ncbi:hypothetical protein E2542_SST18765 [Spatholobus suberectus]|nr:hypothetical protein E2542_SST18765 [Spatholobus suberectus]
MASSGARWKSCPRDEHSGADSESVSVAVEGYQGPSPTPYSASSGPREHGDNSVATASSFLFFLSLYYIGLQKIWHVH